MKNTTKKENKKQAMTNANTQAKTTENGATVITAENFYNLAQIITVKALKTNLASGKGLTVAEYEKRLKENTLTKSNGGQFEYLWRLYSGLVKDIREKTFYSDGADIVQTVALYLWQNVGKKTTDENTDGEKCKDGKTADIWRTAFRVANRYIMGERQKVYKCVYVDDYNENGERLYYEIPENYDIDTAHGYRTYVKIINALNLTDRQAQILKYRLKGLAVDDTQRKNGQPTQAKNNSMRTIAQKIGINPKNVLRHLQAIRKKAKTLAENNTDNDLQEFARLIKKYIK